MHLYTSGEISELRSVAFNVEKRKKYFQALIFRLSEYLLVESLSREWLFTISHYTKRAKPSISDQ